MRILDKQQLLTRASSIGRSAGILLMLFVMILFSLSSFIEALDSFWLQDASRTVSGAFLGVAFLIAARHFWRKL